ncbi:VOC family protein [Nodosilinea sp. LEGE 07298]|uniref:VOC family protein n=1 Tax=Nodosilinea sp. LEGE 07298 TaxID=2777970 RepID=UPI0019E0127A|nr:VOC family protein [Nodosilinea sp. LEGE 07298]MBE9108527.1 VOC family protein [Nodosilinea sp. LEGE 07298]
MALAALATAYPTATLANSPEPQFTAESISTDHQRPDPLAQIRAEHVMISTGDYDGTIAWYRDKLGFQILQEWTVPEFADVQLAYLQLNGFIIEVVSTPNAFQAEQIPADLVTALSDRGFGHLAFLAADVDAVAAELVARGVPLVVPPTSFPDAGRRLIFIQDNNGNYIEFLTPLSAYENHGTVQ